MKRRIVWLLLPAALGTACGNDSDPKSACNQLIDAFTNAWVRCNKSPATARQTWTQAFSSCNPSTVDQARVDQCSGELASADCNFINGGRSPASCNGVLGQ